MCCAIVLMVLPQTPELCCSKLWMFHLGFGFMFGSVLVRSFFLFVLSAQDVSRVILFLLICVCVLCVRSRAGEDVSY